jgi:putative protein kinase ArgK-like GTPase of G3E family
MTRTQASSTDLSPQAHSTISDDIIAEQLAGTEECRDGKPAAIILAGQPGAGKSGLCEALACKI